MTVIGILVVILIVAFIAYFIYSFVSGAVEDSSQIVDALPTTKTIPKYLGNSNTMEIHNLSNSTSSCQLYRMSEENKVYFNTFEGAKKAIESDGYNGCRWCLTEYHTD